MSFRQRPSSTSTSTSTPAPRKHSTWARTNEPNAGFSGVGYIAVTIRTFTLEILHRNPLIPRWYSARRSCDSLDHLDHARVATRVRRARDEALDRPFGE